MKKRYNTEISISNVGESVHLARWVANKRDLGGLIFIDLLMMRIITLTQS